MGSQTLERDSLQQGETTKNLFADFSDIFFCISLTSAWRTFLCFLQHLYKTTVVALLFYQLLKVCYNHRLYRLQHMCPILPQYNPFLQPSYAVLQISSLCFFNICLVVRQSIFYTNITCNDTLSKLSFGFLCCPLYCPLRTQKYSKIQC